MKRVVVIGGANIDILAKSNNTIIHNDSNIGAVKTVCGGVAFNISNNMSQLEIPVSFITTFSYDGFSEMLYKECAKNNIDITYSQKIKGYPSSSYVAILDTKGELDVGVCDNEILSQLDISKIYPLLKGLKEDDIVVVDTNLLKEKIEETISVTKAKIFCDPISTTKAKKLEGLLDRITMFKPNLIEAKQLSGIDTDDYLQLLEYFISQGCQETVISLGDRGVCGTDGKDYYLVDRINCNLVSTTGAGDAFMAGYIYGLLTERCFSDRLILGEVCSALTIESIDTVSENVNKETVEEKFKQVKDNIKVVKLK